MALTLYGSHRSRTKRVLWALAELGLDYEHIPLAWYDQLLKSPNDFAAICHLSVGGISRKLV